jgi:hypothetical protein
LYGHALRNLRDRDQHAEQTAEQMSINLADPTHRGGCAHAAHWIELQGELTREKSQKLKGGRELWK